MPRGKKAQPERLAPLVCAFCGARPAAQNVIQADREGFDWYSGATVGRLACCRACRVAHREEWSRFVTSFGTEPPASSRRPAGGESED